MRIIDPALKSARGRRTAQAFLILAVLAVAVATLTPGPPQPGSSNFACLLCGSRGLADALVNILLFVPVGIGLGLGGMRPRHALLVGAILTTSIEAAQIVIPHRDANPTDILMNSLGVWLGAAAVASFGRWARPSTRAAAWLSASTAGLAVLVFSGTGYLLQPDFPARTYFGQWTPNPEHLAPYDGRVLDARIGNSPMPSRRLSTSAAVREALLNGDSLEIVAVAGSPVRRLAALFSVYDDVQEEVILLGPDGEEMVYRYRTRASGWLLDSPDLRAHSQAARAAPGDTLRLVTWEDARGRCLQEDGNVRCGLGHTVGIGWALLYYVEGLPRSLRTGLNGAWIALWLLPVGYWLRRRAVGAAGLALAIGALAAPALPGGLLPTPVIEWLGALIGLGAGGWLSRRVRGI